MSVISLKFIEGLASHQAMHRRLLDEIFRHLKREGRVQAATVKPVFPGESDPELATMFTVEFEPVDADASEPLRLINELPDIQFAKLSGSRRVLAA